MHRGVSVSRCRCQCLRCQPASVLRHMRVWPIDEKYVDAPASQWPQRLLASCLYQPPAAKASWRRQPTMTMRIATKPWHRKLSRPCGIAFPTCDMVGAMIKFNRELAEHALQHERFRVVCQTFRPIISPRLPIEVIEIIAAWAAADIEDVLYLHTRQPATAPAPPSAAGPEP